MSAVLEKGLYSKLSGGGTSASGRVYPELPQGVTFPAIRYQRVATIRQQALNSTVGVTEATMQVDCMAESYSEAKTLADEVRVLLHGYSGAWSTLVCRNIHLQSENDFFEREPVKSVRRITHLQVGGCVGIHNLAIGVYDINCIIHILEQLLVAGPLFGLLEV